MADIIHQVSGDNYDLGNEGFVRLPEELADKYGIKRDENYWVKVDTKSTLNK